LGPVRLPVFFRSMQLDFQTLVSHDTGQFSCKLHRDTGMSEFNTVEFTSKPSEIREYVQHVIDS
jgi:hypothetical protein